MVHQYRQHSHTSHSIRTCYLHLSTLILTHPFILFEKHSIGVLLFRWPETFIPVKGSSLRVGQADQQAVSPFHSLYTSAISPRTLQSSSRMMLTMASSSPPRRFSLLNSTTTTSSSSANLLQTSPTARNRPRRSMSSGSYGLDTNGRELTSGQRKAAEDKKGGKHADVIDTLDPTGMGSASESIYSVSADSSVASLRTIRCGCSIA